MPFIERFHWLINKRVSHYYYVLLFDYLNRIIVMHLIQTAVLFVNYFIQEDRNLQVIPLLKIS